MTTIFELLKEEEKLVKEVNEIRVELVELKRLRQFDEGNAWTMDFKAIGATTDKLRSAAVQRAMNKFPNTYAQKKAEFENKEEELKTLRHLIKSMQIFGVKEIDDKRKQDTDEGTIVQLSSESKDTD